MQSLLKYVKQSIIYKELTCTVREREKSSTVTVLSRQAIDCGDATEILGLAESVVRT